jgi:hypothetical protein
LQAALLASRGCRGTTFTEAALADDAAAEFLQSP